MVTLVREGPFLDVPTEQLSQQPLGHTAIHFPPESGMWMSAFPLDRELCQPGTVSSSRMHVFLASGFSVGAQSMFRSV